MSDALGDLGMISSTYPGPYRVGTARSDSPKPPPLGTWRYTTARDLGRALYALQAAAAGNRYQQRQTGLSRGRARLALELLLAGWTGGDNAGLVKPFVREHSGRAEERLDLGHPPDGVDRLRAQRAEDRRRPRLSPEPPVPRGPVPGEESPHFRASSVTFL